jgi:pimeloyl-ACP methyl ester carboxylesterase
MRTRRHFPFIALFVAALAVWASHRPAAVASHLYLDLGRRAASPGPLALAPCRVRGFDSETRCGRLQVYENRKAGAGRTIGLNVVVLPSLAQPAPGEPLFFLAGGPGQSAVTAAPLLPFLPRLRRQRDIVLVDQRGTGDSGALSCGEKGEATPFLEDDARPEKLRECLGKLAADPRYYTTDLAMADLDDVRQALGYERINLLGGSYGTRAALVYMKMFPAHVRAAILDGVAPYGNRLPVFMARDADRALAQLFDDCAADADCAAAFSDLPGKLRRVHDRLTAAPALVRMRHPVTGEETEGRLTADVFMGVVRMVLYSSDASALLPWMVSRAEAGDFGPMAAVMEQGRWGLLRRMMSPALLLSVICTEDVPFVQPAELRSAGLFAGATARLAEPCSFWPRGTIPADLREPVISDVPTLLLSGALDPVTPPSWAEEAAKTLRHSRHIVVPGTGHGASGVGCIPRVMEAFLKSGQVEGLDVACAARERRPPFVVGPSGPRP